MIATYDGMNKDAQPAIEQQLHELDAELNRIRKEIFLLQGGLRVVDNREQVLAELNAQYQSLGEQFVALYRRWSQSQVEESEAESADGQT